MYFWSVSVYCIDGDEIGRDHSTHEKDHKCEGILLEDLRRSDGLGILDAHGKIMLK